MIDFLKKQLFKKPQIGFPNGHYYSPVINLEEVLAKKDQIWPKTLPKKLPGIDLNDEVQLNLLKDFEKYYPEVPFASGPKEGYRYYFENDFYSYGDGLNLYNMMRHFRPKNIIEVGSGFSSALMLDVNSKFFSNSIQLTFIEPYTERLESLLKPEDRKSASILQKPVQEIPLSVFEKLESNDILFIDSTHVSKTGSDVNYLFFEVLPLLKKGVIVHIHDVYYPFEYPVDMIQKGLSWNEDYLLRSFLTFNNSFEIILFGDYIHKFHAKAFENMPISYQNSGANIWIRKV